MSKEVIRAFLEASGHDVSAIDDDTDLIESRLIDSLHFVEFVFYLEEAAGCQIDPRDLSINDLRTIDSIERKFFT